MYAIRSYYARPDVNMRKDSAWSFAWAMLRLSFSLREISCATPTAFEPRITSYNVCYTKLLRDLLRHADRVRALGDDHHLAFEVRGRLQATRAQSKPSGLTGEGGNAEHHLFETLLAAGGPAAFDVDGAVLDQWDAVRRIHRHQIDGKLGSYNFV